MPRFIPYNRPFIPGILTAGNAFCGFLSITYAMEGNFLTASWLIILAAVYDALDGMIARLTHSYSKFGIEFDSLADVISFGAAPSVLIYMTHLQYLGVLGLSLSFIPLLFGSIRLARFNANLNTFEKGNFTGLPIPVQASALASYLIFSSNIWDTIRYPMFFDLYVIFLGLLMISNFEYEAMPKFTFKKDRRNTRKLFMFVAASVTVIIFPKETIFPFSLMFVMYGFIRGVFVSLTQDEEEVVDLSRIK